MAERKFETIQVATSNDDLAERVLEARGQGFRLEAISMAGWATPSGVPPSPSMEVLAAALTWIRDPESAAQLVGEFIDLDSLPDQVRRLETAGYAPALVAAVRDVEYRPLFRIIYERFSGSANQRPKLLYRSRNLDEFRAELFADPGNGVSLSYGYHPRSVCVLESVPHSVERPWFLGVQWPFQGRAFDWGITYWKAGEHYSLPRLQAMAAGGRPWIVAPALEKYIPPSGRSSGQIEARLLVIWRDRFFRAWPTPKPFDQAAGRDQEILIAWASGNGDVDNVIEENRSKGYELLSWGLRGSRVGERHYALNFIPAGAMVQTRKFIMSGPGNLSDAVDTRDLRFVGDTLPSVNPVTAPWLNLRSAGLGPTFRPGPPGPSGQLPDLQETDTELPEVAGVPTHPFDLVMWRWMLRNGTRAAQLAVNRHGELRFSRSYTWAENGYPITKTYHRMRSGSVSKNVNALPLVRHYLRLSEGNPNDPGLDRKFNDELQIDSEEAAFHEVTVRQALAHTSGITQNMSYAAIIRLLRPQDEPASDEYGLVGDFIPAPGEMRRAFQSWPDPLIVAPPGTVEEYHNFTYIAFAELWSGISTSGQDWGVYDDALRRTVLERADVIVSRAGSQLTYDLCAAQDEVAYHPHEISVFRPNAAQPNSWVLTPYVRHVPFSGNVCISMRQQARILALLTRRPNRPPYLTPDQNFIMTGRPSAGVYNDPLGWGSASTKHFFAGGHAMIYAIKDGGLPGTLAWVVHCFPPRNSSLSEEWTIDFAVALNGDQHNANPMEELFEAAKAVEAGGLWSPIDLTDGSDFDEEP